MCGVRLSVEIIVLTGGESQKNLAKYCQFSNDCAATLRRKESQLQGHRIKGEFDEVMHWKWVDPQDGHYWRLGQAWAHIGVHAVVDGGFFFALAPVALAGPASPATFKIQQPNGSVFSARVLGDEFQN